MRICIIGLANISRMPYLHPYIRILEEMGVNYEVITWRRMDELDEDQQGVQAFTYKPHSGLPGVLLGYLKYHGFLRSKIKGSGYDGYILLGMQAGILCTTIIGNRPFIQDVRDYTHENIPPYRWLVHNVLHRADLVCISSRGFERWLPRNVKYIITHNIQLNWKVSDDIGFQNNRRSIAFIGQIAESYVPALSKVIMMMRSCPSFILKFHGDGPGGKKLQKYCSDLGAENVKFYGRYKPSEKEQLIQNAAFLLATYGSHNLVVSTSSPNKLTDACIHRRPIIVNDGTFLSEVVKEYGLGVVINFDSTQGLGIQLEQYYEPKVFAGFIRNCDCYLTMVSRDMNEFKNKVIATVNSWG